MDDDKVSHSHFFAQEIVLVTEVAALGDEADYVEDLVDLDAASFRSKASKDIGGLASQGVDWSTSTVVLQDTRIQASDEAQFSDELKGTVASHLEASATSGKGLNRQSTTAIELLLDRWEEPVDKDSKVRYTSRHIFSRMPTHTLPSELCYWCK